MKRQYEIKMPNNFKRSFCEQRNTSDRSINNAGGTCVKVEDLYVPHCISEDGTELQPIRWWKDIWMTDKSIQNIMISTLLFSDK